MEILEEMKEGFIYALVGFVIMFGIAVFLTLPVAILMSFAMYMDCNP